MTLCHGKLTACPERGFPVTKKEISAYNAGASYTPGNIFVFKGAWRFGGVNIARLAVNGSKSTLNWLCSLTDFECIQSSSGIFSYNIRITACAPKFPAAMSIFCIFQHSHIERRLLTLKRAAIELTQYSVSISGNIWIRSEHSPAPTMPRPFQRYHSPNIPLLPANGLRKTFPLIFQHENNIILGIPHHVTIHRICVHKKYLCFY